MTSSTGGFLVPSVEVQLRKEDKSSGMMNAVSESCTAFKSPTVAQIFCKDGQFYLSDGASVAQITLIQKRSSNLDVSKKYAVRMVDACGGIVQQKHITLLPELHQRSCTIRSVLLIEEEGRLVNAITFVGLNQQELLSSWTWKTDLGISIQINKGDLTGKIQFALNAISAIELVVVVMNCENVESKNDAVRELMLMQMGHSILALGNVLILVHRCIKDKASLRRMLQNKRLCSEGVLVFKAALSGTWMSTKENRWIVEVTENPEKKQFGIEKKEKCQEGRKKVRFDFGVDEQAATPVKKPKWDELATELGKGENNQEKTEDDEDLKEQGVVERPSPRCLKRCWFVSQDWVRCWKECKRAKRHDGACNCLQHGLGQKDEGEEVSNMKLDSVREVGGIHFDDRTGRRVDKYLLVEACKKREMPEMNSTTKTKEMLDLDTTIIGVSYI
eukprot:TRINITY_DN31979_c0_g1_i1.p1 TRINITY_DN31979_c0_g1~~TRINITY_DN31979_c0_g1_i1.p1  ORF type:complete len:460 (+),score=83.70 TRINITY_DN31979_c0_g1_i1:47-1381(+)